MKVILLIGPCGSGKTWVMKELIKKLAEPVRAKIGMVSYIRDDNVVIVGNYDGSTFEGSDKLSMAVMRDVFDFLYVMEQEYKYVVVEGDRFTNKNFISAAKPIIIKIMDDGAAGRKKRGSNQTERQIKSIQTRVNNIAADFEVKDSAAALRKICKLVGK